MKTPITDALRAKHNIARMGCEDLFEQLQAFELQLTKQHPTMVLVPREAVVRILNKIRCTPQPRLEPKRVIELVRALDEALSE